MSDEFTRPYFEAMQRFEFALKHGNYRGALTELRLGLKLTPPALKSMYAGYPHVPSIPFINDGGYLAALLDDAESFDLMDDVNAVSFVDGMFDIAQFRRDAEIMQTVRDHLAEVRMTTLAALKERFTADDAARLTRLTNWMSKFGDLSKERIGTATAITSGRPTQKPEQPVPQFRDGMPIQPTPVLKFLRRTPGNEVVDHKTKYPENNFEAATTVIDERRLQKDRRQPSMMSTRVTQDGSWLLATSKKYVDGSSSTVVNRYQPDGTWIQQLTLPHGVKHQFSSPSRPEIVTVDAALNVRIYTFDGSMVAALGLIDTPEIRKIFEDAVEDDRTVRLRVIDASFTLNQIAIAYADYVWLFTLDGAPIVSFRVPAVPTYDIPTLSGDAPRIELQASLVAQGLPSDATQREIAAWLDIERVMPRAISPSGVVSVSVNLSDEDEDEGDLFSDLGNVTELDAIVQEVGSLKADWVYFVRLANDGESLWISTYSGLLARVSHAGEVLDSWKYPVAVDDLWEHEERVFAVFPSSVVEVQPGVISPPIWSGFGFYTMVGATTVAKRYERNVVVGNLLTGTRKTVALARNFKAFYPIANGVRVETTNTYADIEI